METIQVNVRRVRADQMLDIEADIHKAEILAKLMDAQFEVGGVKFGLDAIIGLVPVAGDVAGMVIGLYPVFLARKHRLGKIVITRMIWNLTVDMAAGAIPVLGDLVDIMIRANIKNVELLKSAAKKVQSNP